MKGKQTMTKTGMTVLTITTVLALMGAAQAAACFVVTANTANPSTGTLTDLNNGQIFTWNAATRVAVPTYIFDPIQVAARTCQITEIDTQNGCFDEGGACEWNPTKSWNQEGSGYTEADFVRGYCSAMRIYETSANSGDYLVQYRPALRGISEEGSGATVGTWGVSAYVVWLDAAGDDLPDPLELALPAACVVPTGAAAGTRSVGSCVWEATDGETIEVPVGHAYASEIAKFRVDVWHTFNGVERDSGKVSITCECNPPRA